jgi:very-short-patch-repair endonuclease
MLKSIEDRFHHDVMTKKPVLLVQARQPVERMVWPPFNCQNMRRHSFVLGMKSMSEQSNRTGCLGAILGIFGFRFKDQQQDEPVTQFPYRLRDDFLSPAELSFFGVLEQSVSHRFSIHAKVRLADIVFVASDQDRQAYRNRINSKHIDFLLCDTTRQRPLLVIELDDSSHSRKDRHERDCFVDQVLQAAELPILHVKAAKAYSVAELTKQIDQLVASDTVNAKSTPPLPSPPGLPECPKCRVAMVQRTAQKGVNAGKRFWACRSFPNCRYTIPID